jgi:hypothetical protein
MDSEAFALARNLQLKPLGTRFTQVHGRWAAQSKMTDDSINCSKEFRKGWTRDGSSSALLSWLSILFGKDEAAMARLRRC